MYLWITVELIFSSTFTTINGLPDHDAQILTITNLYATINNFLLKQRTRLINNETIMNFQTLQIKKPGNLDIRIHSLTISLTHFCEIS
jgi:hypothetical protein